MTRITHGTLGLNAKAGWICVTLERSLAVLAQLPTGVWSFRAPSSARAARAWELRCRPLTAKTRSATRASTVNKAAAPQPASSTMDFQLVPKAIGSIGQLPHFNRHLITMALAANQNAPFTCWMMLAGCWFCIFALGWQAWKWQHAVCKKIMTATWRVPSIKFQLDLWVSAHFCMVLYRSMPYSVFWFLQHDSSPLLRTNMMPSHVPRPSTYLPKMLKSHKIMCISVYI